MTITAMMDAAAEIAIAFVETYDGEYPVEVHRAWDTEHGKIEFGCKLLSPWPCTLDWIRFSYPKAITNPFSLESRLT